MLKLSVGLLMVPDPDSKTIKEDVEKAFDITAVLILSDAPEDINEFGELCELTVIPLTRLVSLEETLVVAESVTTTPLESEVPEI